MPGTKGITLEDVETAIKLLKEEKKDISGEAIANILNCSRGAVARPYQQWRLANGYKLKKYKRQRKSILDVKPISATDGLRQMVKAFLLTKEEIELVKEVYSVSTIEVIQLPTIQE